MDIPRRKDPLFIIGLPMSGASWLWEVLDAHPRLAVVRDSPWIAGGDGISTPFKALFQTLIDDRRGPVKNFAGLGEGHIAASLAQAVSVLLDAYVKARRKARWIDATPQHIVEIPYVVRLFPTGRFIHIVRDGRDVACAVCREGDGSGDHFWAGGGDGRRTTHVSILRRWCEWIDQLDQWSEKFQMNVLAVPFERLCENPDEEVRKIFEYIDEPWDERLADLSRRMENTPHAPLPGDFGRWRRQFPPHELAEAASFSNAALSGYGYEPIERPATISARAGELRTALPRAEDSNDTLIHVCGILHKDAPCSPLGEALQHVGKDEFAVEIRWVETGDAAAGITNPDLLKRLKQLVGMGGVRDYDLNDLAAEVNVFRRWLEGDLDIVHYLDGERSVQYLPRILHKLHGLRQRPALVATFCQAPDVLRATFDHRALKFLDHVIVTSRELEDHFRHYLPPERISLVQQVEGGLWWERASVQLERVYRLLTPQKMDADSANSEADTGSVPGEPPRWRPPPVAGTSTSRIARSHHLQDLRELRNHPPLRRS